MMDMGLFAIEKIQRLSALGLDAKQISRELELHPPANEIRPYMKPIPEQMRQDIRRRVESGELQWKIAQDYDLPTGSVSHLARYKMPPLPPRPKRLEVHELLAEPVIELLEQGYSFPEIGRQLSRTKNSIVYILSRLYARYNVSNRYDLVRVYRERQREMNSGL